MIKVMNRKNPFRGFTLVELMIVVAIVALLVALALPSYTRYVRKANRGEAVQLMLQYANLQEIWRTNDTNYATSVEIVPPTHARYDFFVRATASSPPGAADCANAAPTATAYTVVACAKAGTDQVNDDQAGVSCQRLSLNQSNTKAPLSCW
jgi:type IV pilus assembly protein PilE